MKAKNVREEKPVTEEKQPTTEELQEIENDFIAKLEETAAVEEPTEDRAMTSFDLFMRDISAYPLLTPEEEKELTLRVANGDAKAKEELINHNLRLVIKVAKRYATPEHSLMDCIQSGSLGLLRAADEFRPEKGFKFSTYAVWWIRQAVTRASMEDTLIRQPVHRVDALRRVNRAKRDFLVTNGRMPTIAEVAEMTGMSMEKVYDLITVDMQTAAVSYDRTVDEDEETDLLSFIPDSREEEQRDYKNMQDVIRGMLMTLKPKEREILAYRFGLAGGRGMSLEEVGQKYGVSKERIRQIEAKALDKLRESKYSKVLRQYY